MVFGFSATKTLYTGVTPHRLAEERAGEKEILLYFKCTTVPPEFKAYRFSKRERKLQYAGGCCLVCIMAQEHRNGNYGRAVRQELHIQFVMYFHSQALKKVNLN